MKTFINAKRERYEERKLSMQIEQTYPKFYLGLMTPVWF